MSALEPAGQPLEIMGLNQAVEVLDNNLNATTDKHLPHVESLEQPLGTARWRALTSARGSAWPTFPSSTPLSSSTSLPGLPLRTPDPGTGRSRAPKSTEVPCSGSFRIHVGPKTAGHSGTNIGFRPGALPAETPNRGH